MTIEEMALRDLPVIITGNDWDENEKKRDGYIQGANAVLEEIEWILEQGYYSNKNILIEIRNLVDELKNE